MDQSGQTYFEDEGRIPQANLDRMRDAEWLELARRVQADKDRRLVDELLPRTPYISPEGKTRAEYLAELRRAIGPTE